MDKKRPNFAPLLERIREQLFAPLTVGLYGSDQAVVWARDDRNVLQEVGMLGESLASLDRRTRGEPTSKTQIRFVDVAPPPITEPSGVDEWFVRVPISQSQEIARARVRYVFFAFVTISLGLLVRDRAASLSDAVLDPLGDAIWAMMMTWWVSALMPRAGLLTRVSVAFAICVGVELSQLAHWPALDALRQTMLGRLVLGSDFDPRDLAAYALGVSIVGWLDRTLLTRRRDATPTL